MDDSLASSWNTLNFCNVSMPLSQYIAKLWWILSKFCKLQIFFAIKGLYGCSVTEQTSVVKTLNFYWWLLAALLIGFCVLSSYFFYLTLINYFFGFHLAFTTRTKCLWYENVWRFQKWNYLHNDLTLINGLRFINNL